MSQPHPERLRAIKTLPQLATYLREELDWPIESDDSEDITFDYDPADLGLDKDSAVRIREIKQLRPLTSSQPWGIFFISFEKKRLPVVVMRRILSALVLRKRTNKSERPAWRCQPSMNPVRRSFSSASVPRGRAGSAKRMMSGPMKLSAFA